MAVILLDLQCSSLGALANAMYCSLTPVLRIALVNHPTWSLFTGLNAKDIDIQLLHNTKNNTQTLHEPIDSNP
jgi:hypothetical protein